jgi:hypothetical protein
MPVACESSRPETENGSIIRRRIGGAVAHVKDVATDLLSGDYFAGLPEVAPSVMLPRGLAVKNASETEAQGYRPIVLTVEAPKDSGLLRSTAAAMVGQGQAFGDIRSVSDVTSALSSLEIAFKRKEPIGLVVVDAGIREGDRGWKDIAKAVKKEKLARSFVLLSDATLSLKERREFGVDRVISKRKNSRELRVTLTNVTKKVFPSAS